MVHLWAPCAHKCTQERTSFASVELICSAPVRFDRLAADHDMDGRAV
jgi:hypothetical protein